MVSTDNWVIVIICIVTGHGDLYLIQSTAKKTVFLLLFKSRLYISTVRL